MGPTRRLKLRTLAVTLALGTIAAISLLSTPPAGAQTLEISTFTMTFTSDPNVWDIIDQGPCPITSPTTNCWASATWPLGPIDVFTLFNLTLFSLDQHFALSSIVIHLPLHLMPNCLVVLSGARLINLDASESFSYLGVVGTYSIQNCNLVVAGTLTLLLGGTSPSSGHLNITMGTAHL